jgi:hypothetical protein
MPGLAAERCFHHETREAVGRCPECRRFFCRECVVPFDRRLLCAACIARANEPPLLPEKSSALSGQLLLGTTALVFIWVIFYCLGWIILQYRETLPVEVAEKGRSPRACSEAESNACGCSENAGRRLKIAYVSSEEPDVGVRRGSGDPAPLRGSASYSGNV